MGAAPAPVLRGHGVLLNGHTVADIAAHLAGEDEETARRFGWWPEKSTETTARAAYARWAAEWRSGGNIRAFAVRDAVTGHLVGGCELRLQADESGQISWWTHAAERRKGYATRALRLLVPCAESLGVDRLEAHVAPDNDASRKVAESAIARSGRALDAWGAHRGFERQYRSARMAPVGGEYSFAVASSSRHLV